MAKEGELLMSYVVVLREMNTTVIPSGIKAVGAYI
jgi:hypothetical protein